MGCLKPSYTFTEHYFISHMKFCISLFLACFICFSNAINTYAEITISYPLERTVFQRDKNNFANVTISGNFTDVIDRIEVQFRAIQGGHTSDWITIQQNPQGGYFQGSVNWSGGWYELEVRGFFEHNYIGSAYLSRVGIGEVFIIAGQSNAQGLYGLGGVHTNDDRVNCVNEFNVVMSYGELSQPRFSHMDQNSTVGPRGQSSWYWGKLGEMLCQRLNVPVLFYNAGWEGTTSTNWKESTTGNTKSPYVDAWYQDRMPYGNMMAIFTSYLPVTGVRGVLWHQGESDNRFIISTQTHFDNLRAVIDKSRQDSGHNLSWVVARASYDQNRGGTAQRIIDAQNQVVNNISNVFYGPETDNIQPIRQEGVHFYDNGLHEVANAWFNSLNDDFFQRSEPVRAVNMPSISVNCAGNNQLTLTVHDDLRSVNWNNGSNNRSVNVGGGSYKAKITTNSGQVIYSPEIRVPGQVQPATPNIRLEGSNPICIGNEATLIADNVIEARWNTGFVGNRMTISTAGDFQVNVKNIYGCEAQSNVISVGVISSPLPPVPNINIEGSTTFCEGGVVSLTSTSQVNNTWSNGSGDKTLQIHNTGIYSVRAIDNQGCYSAFSSPVTITVHPNPAKPFVGIEGSTIFCEGGNVKLTSNYEQGNTWNNGNNNRDLTITTSGTFNVTYRDQNGCESSSDHINVHVNPLPAAPQITALRPTEFCERDYTLLQSNSQPSYQWSNGNPNPEVEVRTSGDYYLTTTDHNGCRSLPSASVRVQVNPLPQTPVITADRSTTICENEFVTLSSTPENRYIWNNGAETSSIRINTEGNYYIQTINNFNCTSDPSNSFFVNTLPLPNRPEITVQGLTDFCYGETLPISATASGELFWNTGEINDTIYITESGNYTVKTLAENGCYSYNSDTVDVLVRPVPDKPIIEQSGTFTIMANISIEEGNFAWHRDLALISGESNKILKAKQTGSYTVRQSIKYTDVLTCFSEISDAYFYRLEDSRNGLSVFPNPNRNGKFTIETLEDYPNAIISIYNVKGDILLQMKNIDLKERHYLDISGYTAGMYFLKVEYLNEKSVQKLILTY